MQYLNIWNHDNKVKKYFEINENDIVFELGEYKIFKQFYNCYLYTYKNIAINQLAGINKEHIIALHENKRPYGSKGFLFDRANETLKKALEIIN